MYFGFDKLKGMQSQFGESITLNPIDLAAVKRIAGFDCAMTNNHLTGAVVVVDYPSMTLVEKRSLTKPAPMPYVPEFLAFREGPIMLELFYELESDPDVLMIDGHGIAHPRKAGLAAYIGTETQKPTLGIAKGLLIGDVQGDDILLNGEVVGRLVKTKQYAKPIFVSPGNLITVEQAAQLAHDCVRLPHKLPEPLHLAHRYADRMMSERAGSDKHAISHECAHEAIA